jgi:Zn-finger nucleic acid-binding protein
MTNCINCGAALPANTIVCNYCKTRQDVDLKGMHRHTTTAPLSERICPRCKEAMHTIDLKLGGKFLIERCNTCMGMFFDPGELEALLDKSVSNVYHIDYQQLQNLKAVKRHDEYPVTYINCPICQKFMNRINFGTASGVIVDTCKGHGIWLDGGELRHLLEWTKAGGKMHHQQNELEIKRLNEQEEARKKKELLNQTGIGENGSQSHQGFARFETHSHRDFGETEDLFSVVTSFVSRFFK